jgi:hypothetical protein
MKKKINMIGGGFQHDICSSAGYVPNLIEWDKTTHSSNISIHVDFGIMNVRPNKNKINYGWLSESKTINFNLYQWCSNNVNYLEENFELIFTHDISLLSLSNKFKLVICSAKPWVKNYKIHKKTKLISMIASSKIICDEHRYRQEVISKYKNDLDLFGRGYKEIQNKEIGLNDYNFSITMENHTYPIAYSEKITDCFATGTIPIYYGCDLKTVFNTDGIIMFNDDFDIKSLSNDLYQSKMDAIIENFEIVINMPIAEDYIYENFIK